MQISNNTISFGFKNPLRSPVSQGKMLYFKLFSQKLEVEKNIPFFNPSVV